MAIRYAQANSAGQLNSATAELIAAGFTHPVGPPVVAGSNFIQAMTDTAPPGTFEDLVDRIEALEAHTHALGDLTDVDVAGAQAGEQLTYDGEGWAPDAAAPE
jgi:hypothetical protein